MGGQITAIYNHKLADVLADGGVKFAHASHVGAYPARGDTGPEGPYASSSPLAFQAQNGHRLWRRQ